MSSWLTCWLEVRISVYSVTKCQGSCNTLHTPFIVVEDVAEVVVVVVLVAVIAVVVMVVAVVVVVVVVFVVVAGVNILAKIPYFFHHLFLISSSFFSAKQ